MSLRSWKFIGVAKSLITIIEMIIMQSWHWCSQGLHCYCLHLSILWDSWVQEGVGVCLFYMITGLILICWIAFFNVDIMAFPLYNYTLLCYNWLLSLGRQNFLVSDSGFRRKRRYGWTGMSIKRENYNQDILY